MFLRMAGDAAEVDAIELGQRIAGAGVLGLASRRRGRARGSPGRSTTFSSTVPKRSRGGEDLGLALAPQADHLGVAAALEVEDAVVAPAVLVVADQRALGIGREGRLAGAREAEEERHVVAVAAVVGAAVHGEDALLRQQVVHHAEDALLDLAGVLGAADQHQALGEVDQDEGRGAGAVGRRIGVQPGQSMT